MGCFIKPFFWIAACIIRAIWSEAPPAPAATTISTGLVGSQATAGAAASTSASAVQHERIGNGKWPIWRSPWLIGGVLRRAPLSPGVVDSRRGEVNTFPKANERHVAAFQLLWG